MKRFVSFLCAGILTVLATLPALAHGVRVTGAMDPTTGEVTLTAQFDTGEPLANAQVVIFAPNDLVNPWGTGVADANGVFTFMPDYTLEGFWDVQVRLAGHGGLVNVEIRSEMAPDERPAEETAATSTVALEQGARIVVTGNAEFIVNGDIMISASGAVVEAESSQTPSVMLGNGFTPAQVAIMSVSVIWGFIGSALYFWGRRK